MSSRIRLAIPAVLGAALLAAPALAAQPLKLPRVHAVELTFSAGYFQPTGPAGSTGSLALNRRPAWEAGVHFGAYSKSGRLGAEVSAGYTPERVSQGGMGSRRTHLTYGTLKGLIGKSPRKPGVSVMGGAGLSVLRRKKSLLDSSEGATSLGGVLSVFVRIPMDDQVGLRLDAEDLVYRADFGSGKKLHNDFVLTLGLGISW